MKTQILRITENDLHNIIKESVNNILAERNVDNFTPYSQEDRERNFQGLQQGDDITRNNSYLKALVDSAKKGSRAAIKELDKRGINWR